MSAKQHAPATSRNREAILAVLREELPSTGRVLEVASGSGEHAVFFAGHFPALEWQPSDPDRQALASIAAYRAEYPGTNCSAAIMLDAQAPGGWELPGDQPCADAIVCINMVHISPWSASIGLFAGAARFLSGKNAPLILYGPYFEQGVDPAPSNLEFDASLRSRNAQWGIRHVEEMDALAAEHGLVRTRREAMPANNLMLIYRAA